MRRATVCCPHPRSAVSACILRDLNQVPMPVMSSSHRATDAANRGSQLLSNRANFPRIRHPRPVTSAAHVGCCREGPAGAEGMHKGDTRRAKPIEPLEPRWLLSAVNLTLDVETNTLAGLGSSDLDSASLNGEIFFAATDPGVGTELYKSDGTAAGTVRVKDIRPGSASASPSRFFAWDGAVYFSANDGVNGNELWKTDGTEAGTVLFKEFVTGSVGVISDNLVDAGDMLLFTNSSANITKLWRTDGTEAGTSLVYEFSTEMLAPSRFFHHTGVTYFVTGYHATTGEELWKTD